MGGVRPKIIKEKKKGEGRERKKRDRDMLLNARICFPNFSKISDNG